MTTPDIVALPGFTAIGLAITTTPKSPEIAQLWQRFGPQMPGIPNRTGRSFGVMEMREGQLHYLAGCETTPDQTPPPNMNAWVVPANTYAALKTTVQTVGQTFDELYGQWLPTSGYARAAGPDLERYDDEFETNGIFTVLVPVQKR